MADEPSGRRRLGGRPPATTPAVPIQILVSAGDLLVVTEFRSVSILDPVATPALLRAAAQWLEERGLRDDQVSGLQLVEDAGGTGMLRLYTRAGG